MKIGDLSAKYESNGKPDSVSYSLGDSGGVSYGTYQLATNTGSVQEFVQWTKVRYKDIYRILSSGSLQKSWKEAYIAYPKIFPSIQWTYIKSKYFDIAVNLILKYYKININKRSFALQNVIWSTAVQHGSAGAATIFGRAKARCNPNSDALLIRAIYQERGAEGGEKYFKGNSEEIRRSVCQRFRNECSEALRLL